MGKTIAVDQLNDTTAFPWFLNLFKNFSADYRKYKSNHWDYLVSIHDFIPVEEDLRNYLIEKYNKLFIILFR